MRRLLKYRQDWLDSLCALSYHSQEYYQQVVWATYTCPGFPPKLYRRGGMPPLTVREKNTNKHWLHSITKVYFMTQYQTPGIITFVTITSLIFAMAMFNNPGIKRLTRVRPALVCDCLVCLSALTVFYFIFLSFYPFSNIYFAFPPCLFNSLLFLLYPSLKEALSCFYFWNYNCNLKKRRKKKTKLTPQEVVVGKTNTYFTSVLKIIGSLDSYHLGSLHLPTLFTLYPIPP